MCLGKLGKPSRRVEEGASRSAGTRSKGFAREMARRLVVSFVALLASALLVFAATEALPGDTAQAILGDKATPPTLARLRAELGLDRPFSTRYSRWILGVSHADLGESVSSGKPVWSLLGPRLRNSLLLASLAVLLAVPASVLLGLVSALRRGSWLDGSISFASLAILSLPEFVLGILLAVIVGVWWGVLPPISLFSEQESPIRHFQQLILPALAATGVVAGYIIRMTRAAAIDVLASDYVQAARLRGVAPARLLRKHVLPNALIPIVNVIGATTAWMFGGLVIVESVFAFPGIGSLLVSAVGSQDQPLIAGVALVITAAYLLVNLLADVCVVLLNPRLRAGVGGGVS